MTPPENRLPEVRNGFGPLLQVLYVRERRLRALFQQPVGSAHGPCTVILDADGTPRLRFDINGTELRMLLKPAHSLRGNGPRLDFDDTGNAWLMDEARTDRDYLAVRDALLAAIGLKPSDMLPYTPLR